MELIAIWNLVRRRWWLILLPAVVALILTLPSIKNIVAPPVSYTVALRLTAAAPPDTAIEGVTTPYEDTSYVPLLASEYVVVNLPAWITSDSFAREVSMLLAEENVTIAVDDLEGAFAADSFRSILTLYVAWDDEAEIRSMADAAVQVLQTKNQRYFPQFAATPVEVRALDDVEVVESASAIMSRLEPLIRLAVGLAAGVALAVLAEYLDRGVHTADDVEALGLAVWGEIPSEK